MIEHQASLACKHFYPHDECMIPEGDVYLGSDGHFHVNSTCTVDTDGCCCVSDPFNLYLETDSQGVSKPLDNTDCCGYWDYQPREKRAR